MMLASLDITVPLIIIGLGVIYIAAAVLLGRWLKDARKAGAVKLLEDDPRF